MKKKSSTTDFGLLWITLLVIQFYADGNEMKNKKKFGNQISMLAAYTVTQKNGMLEKLATACYWFYLFLKYQKW